MNYDDEMLSNQGWRDLALHITRAVIDTVPSEHDARDDYEFSAHILRTYEATPAETYYKLLSEAHQNMIAAGMTSEKTRSGACSIGSSYSPSFGGGSTNL